MSGKKATSKKHARSPTPPLPAPDAEEESEGVGAGEGPGLGAGAGADRGSRPAQPWPPAPPDEGFSR